MHWERISFMYQGGVADHADGPACHGHDTGRYPFRETSTARLTVRLMLMRQSKHSVGITSAGGVRGNRPLNPSRDLGTDTDIGSDSLRPVGSLGLDGDRGSCELVYRSPSSNATLLRD